MLATDTGQQVSGTWGSDRYLYSHPCMCPKSIVCVQLRLRSIQNICGIHPQQLWNHPGTRGDKHTWSCCQLLTRQKGLRLFPLSRDPSASQPFTSILHLQPHPEPSSSHISQCLSQSALDFPHLSNTCCFTETTQHYQPSSNGSLSHSTNRKNHNKKLSQYWNPTSPTEAYGSTSSLLQGPERKQHKLSVELPRDLGQVV